MAPLLLGLPDTLGGERLPASSVSEALLRPWPGPHDDHPDHALRARACAHTHPLLVAGVRMLAGRGADHCTCGFCRSIAAHVI